MEKGNGGEPERGEPEPEGSQNWMKIGTLKRIEGENLLPTIPSALNKMEQSSVAGTKRKPSMLSLQPPKLKPPQQVRKHREVDLPRTPYPMPSKGSERSVTSSEQDDSPQEGEAKKRKIAGEGEIRSTPPHLANFPSLDSGYSLINQYGGIPPVELMKAWESILDQVDWSEVVQDAGGRENPHVYRDVFKMIVKSHIGGLLKQKERSKDMNIEFGKRDDEDTDTDSGEDAFRHFENNKILESDESRDGSEDYTDDETDDDEDSDDEDQVDDECECEVIDD